jgi:hypothetical protein
MAHRNAPVQSAKKPAAARAGRGGLAGQEDCPGGTIYIRNVAPSENTRPFLYTDVGKRGSLLYW